MPEPAASTQKSGGGSLKRALQRLKIGGHSDKTTPNGSTATLDDASINGKYQPESLHNGARSPPGVASPPITNGGGASPARTGSLRNGHGLGNSSPRASSPRTSGVFGRGSNTFSRTSVAHSPVRALKEKLNIGNDDDSSADEMPLNREGEPMSKNQYKKHLKQEDDEIRKKEREEKEAAMEQRRKEMMERRDAEESPESRARYGVLSPNSYAGEWKHEARINILDIKPNMVGKEVIFRARIHHLRQMSSKLLFLVLRQKTATIQGVLQEHAHISEFMVYWAEHLDVESVVLVRGIVQEPKAKEGKIKGTTVQDVEISVHYLHVEAEVTEILPFSVHEAEVTKSEAAKDHGRIRVSDRTRLANRVIDLRTTAAQSIFRVQHGVCKLFREYLDTQGFIEIHTPKLQGGATESGASVFKLDYFGRPGFLAQSPQLAKQMSIAADFGRVYEIGAVFRAENSNTHRHLTEYTGLDLEMAIDEHYHEVLNVLDRTFKYIFEGLYKHYRHEIETVKRSFPHEDLVWLEKTPIIPFKDGIKLLNESGWRGEDGEELPLDEDLGTRDEIQLGKVIKEKYGTDYYVLDKFPASARPFYAMADPDDENYTNSFDIFVRGQEILSGGQRIHDAKMLLGKMEKLKMDRAAMDDYIQGFEWGAPPHGGGGIGLERILMLILSLGDIRHASMYPRDPKSLPEKPKVKQLRHPEASTMHPPWEGQDRVAAHIDWQPVEQLIANYGDASNTSWLESRTQIWRDEYTGAAVGYVPQDSYAIIVGDPLCHPSQYVKICTAFLRFITKEKKLKPLWLLVNKEMETVLADRFNWRTLSVVSEQRLDPSNNKAAHDSEIQRKIRHAEKEGVKIQDFALGTAVPDELREKVEKRIEDWSANRKGKQVHLTNIHPWQDEEHRQYHIALDKDGTVCALVVMAQLSPDHGWQVKYSLDFPGAPGGAIEYIITHALHDVATMGCTSVTFGGGASEKFVPGHNLKKTRVKVLSRAYHAIITELKLTNKSEFREKLGAFEDPVFIAYPPHGLGPMAVKSIMAFFEADDY